MFNNKTKQAQASYKVELRDKMQVERNLRDEREAHITMLIYQINIISNILLINVLPTEILLNELFNIFYSVIISIDNLTKFKEPVTTK